jgi:hypothetical protein
MAAKMSAYSVIVWPPVLRTTDSRARMNAFVTESIFMPPCTRRCRAPMKRESEAVMFIGLRSKRSAIGIFLLSFSMTVHTKHSTLKPSLQRNKGLLASRLMLETSDAY